MLKIVFSFLIVALFAQDGDILMQMEREKLTTSRSYPLLDMVTIRAIHADGTSARGSINCTGSWEKYGDTGRNNAPLKYGWRLPFKTDSRGAIILNPRTGDFAEDPMYCQAIDKHGHMGETRFTTPTRYQEIIVR